MSGADEQKEEDEIETFVAGQMHISYGKPATDHHQRYGRDVYQIGFQ